MKAITRKTNVAVAALLTVAMCCACIERLRSQPNQPPPKIYTSGASRVPDQRPKKHCIIFVLSHSSRNKGGVTGEERRNSIRETWKKDVPSDSIFKFAMDEPDELTGGEEHHQDILYLNVTQAGEDVRFGEKLLLMSRWAVHNYDFEYMLRIDDDNFLCFEHIVQDLRQLQNPSSIIWGWWFFPDSTDIMGGIESQWAGEKCEKFLSGPTNAEKLYRPDEMGIILSSNLVKFFTSEEINLASWDLMDVSLMKWLYPVKATYLIDNLRFLRGHGKYGPDVNPFSVAGIPLSEFCSTHISFHKAHPKAMRDIWLAGQGVPRVYEKPAIHEKCLSDAGKSTSNHPSLGISW